MCSLFIFFNDTATTEIYTLSLHDALPISSAVPACSTSVFSASSPRRPSMASPLEDDSGYPRESSTTVTAHCEDHSISTPDRKSTRLNSSHANISYAVFCLKKKTTQFQRNP